VAILMREIQKIHPDRWEELEAAEARWAALEKRAGYPDVKKRYRAYSTPDDINTLVIEIEWDSFAAMEAANERLAEDPELEELVAATDQIVQSIRMEFYNVLS
jgi:hypothetical protein